MHIGQNGRYAKTRNLTYVDDGCWCVVPTRFTSTGYAEPRFFSIALSQVHATQTNVVFAVN